jgi:hypothetical protein
MKYIDFDLLGDIMLLNIVIGTSIYFMGVSKVIAYLGITAFTIKIIGLKCRNLGDKLK